MGGRFIPPQQLTRQFVHHAKAKPGSRGRKRGFERELLPHPAPPQGSHDWRLRPRLKVFPGHLLAVNSATGRSEVHSGYKLFN